VEIATKTRSYTHLELGNNVVVGIAGYYVPQQETRLDYNGREVLYTAGQVNLEAACCTTSDWNYIVVPGYIVNWQNTRNEDGLPVSKVEPVTDREERKELTKIIQAREDILTIEFW
jgi:hypothetical protein